MSRRRKASSSQVANGGDPAAREELREIIASDVLHMRGGWSAGDLDWHTVRREAGMLRRLLTEGGAGGDIRRLWRLDGRPGLPMIESADLRPYLGMVPMQTAEFVTLPDLSIGTVMNTETEEGPDFDAIAETWAARPLDRYVKATCILYGHVAIRRADLIEYVANKLGGNHYDRTRDPAKRAAFVALDHFRGRFVLNDRDVLLAQVLGVAQTIAENDDIADLLGLPAAPKREHMYRETPAE